MLPKEDRIKKMFEFLQKYYSDVFGKVFVSESVFFDLLDFIDCNFQEFTYYYQVFDTGNNLYFITELS